MNHHRFIPLCVALLGGCVLAPDVIGATLPGGEPGDSGTSMSGVSCGFEFETDMPETSGGCTSPTSTATDSGGTTVSPPPEGAYGSVCELGLPQDVQSRAVVVQPACEGDICVFPFDDDHPPCGDDGDCSGPYSICGPNGHCELDQGFVAENSRCTHSCSEDADCPAIAGCDGAAVCARLTSLGPLCCEKMCVCPDDLSLGTSEQLEAMCATEDSPCGD